MNTYSANKYLLPYLQQILHSETIKMRIYYLDRLYNRNEYKNVVGKELSLPQNSRRRFSNVTFKRSLAIRNQVFYLEHSERSVKTWQLQC